MHHQVDISAPGSRDCFEGAVQIVSQYLTNIDLKSLDLILKLGQNSGRYMADFAVFSITMNDSAVLY